MADPYASHLPVLEMFNPKRVLEFGPGLYSTKAFLEKPSVEQLVSIEHDPEWIERLQEEFDDSRWNLRRNLGGWPDIEDFDLIFIDDGWSIPHRLKTINRVLGSKHPLVVIHDAEVPEYRDAIGSRPHIIYALSTPHTAVVAP